MLFPKLSNVPQELFDIDGSCGLIAAWAVLDYFKRPFRVDQLADIFAHTIEHGVFTISLAAGLQEMGLDISFHSEDDPNMTEIERDSYSKARALGVSIKPAVDVGYLLDSLKREFIPIVFYNTVDDIGHFSPLLGCEDQYLTLPFSIEDSLSVDEFREAWSAPGILRQCVIVGESTKPSCETRPPAPQKAVR